ncbi:phage terminase large subunit family protein [Desulfitobacterium chlororespirans]|uniref:Phage terminase, large subunit GpA n=1 Tax=Desulfitobacterium chlororespirans DSM 11544 TaxID=1121395 RepID=A0A1M7U3A6_9FIRM|nr:phage terminase large subunit family protein [Desulfitobacterium chlororespirans]SHN77340.1 Phage terminase, large subunit GpA [Desulfitobacterium chlororespirans DSM 11544]
MSQSNKTANLFKRIAKNVAPPPILTVSQWADQYRKLSKEASAEPGQWRTSRTPYMREIMDAMNQAWVETIVMMTSSQVGKTEFLLNIIGYFIHQDPSPIILVQPTLELAQAFSKDRLSPMARDTPELKDKIGTGKSRDSGNTMLHKSFPGGHITMAGANSAASLASRPIRIVLLDEVDRYPASAGEEGDPVSLVTKRSTTFTNRKRVLVSTPTIKGASRIETAYENSTMEQWCLPCPSCGEYQPPSWDQIHFDSSGMVCKHCGVIHAELEWKAGEGKWIARKKNRKTRGFHLNELASPWKRWETIIEEFKEAKKSGIETFKAWTNTSLGESWEEEGEKLDEDALYNRREMYSSDVPDGVKILTAAVDTQDDRFEIEVQGWGAGHENWRIQYHVIYGDLKQPRAWTELDEYLKRSWRDAEGRLFSIAATCMDSGGHLTNEVYKFCKERAARRIFPIKGESPGDGTYLPLIIGTSTNNRYKATVIRLGVDEGKFKVMSALGVLPVDESGNKSVGYCHFPLTTPDKNRGYERQYFDGLTSEVMQKRYKKGVPYYVWVKVKVRNEPFDLAVYNRAAIELLQPDLDNMQPFCTHSAIVKTPAAAPTKRRRGTSSSV